MYRFPLGEVAILLIGMALGGISIAAPVHAQEDVSPDSILALLTSGRPEAVNEASVRVLRAFQSEYDQYSDMHREALLMGLEAIAMREEEETAEDRRAKRGAVSSLNSIIRDTIDVAEDARASDALIRVLEGAPGRGARVMAVGGLVRTFTRLESRQQSRVLGILEAAAVAEPSATGSSLHPGRFTGFVTPRSAIDQLVAIGAAAVPTLRRLDVNSLVQDRDAARYLRSLAGRGYAGRGGQ